jgi:hypothetical protein
MIFIITESTTYCDVCSIMIAKLSVNVFCVTINNTFLWRHAIVRTVDYSFKNLQFILLFLNIW